MARRLPSVPLWIQIVAGMVVGVVVGVLAGPSAGGLGEIGKLVIQLIKAAATPLLFFSIVNAILNTEIGGKAGLRMIAIAVFNVSIAICIGLLISNVLEPGSHLDRAATASIHGKAVQHVDKLDFLATLASYLPTSVAQPFVDNLIIPLVLIAVVVGAALRRVRRDAEADGNLRFAPVEDVVAALLRMTEVVLGWIIKLVPFAVFGVVAKAVGEYGFEPLAGLGVYVAVGLVGLAIHALVTYHLWLVLYVKMPLGRFWKSAKDPVIYAAGANSSLATLPLTLQALDRLGVSRASSTLGACVGTNLNNDGIVLYEAMAVLFVAQAHGLHLGAGDQLLAIVACMVAAMGIAGVPEAGFISLSVVLMTVGLPDELLPLLLTVDWIIARGRSVVNVLSDMLVSIILDRWSGRRFEADPDST